MTMYWRRRGVFLVGFLLIHRIIHSPFGQVLKAIRENEPRAISLGYRTDDYKLIAFILSGHLAGLAGATKAIVFQLARSPTCTRMSGEVVLMTLLGGMGTIFGCRGRLSSPRCRTTWPSSAPGSRSSRASSSVRFLRRPAFRRGIVGERAAKLKNVALNPGVASRRPVMGGALDRPPGRGRIVRRTMDFLNATRRPLQPRTPVPPGFLSRSSAPRPARARR